MSWIDKDWNATGYEHWGDSIIETYEIGTRKTLTVEELYQAFKQRMEEED